MTPHIVIIDDETITLKQLRRILEKEGYSVAAFSSPQRALKHIEEAPCHLVISDVRMPTMSGLDLMPRAYWNATGTASSTISHTSVPPWSNGSSKTISSITAWPVIYCSREFLMYSR